MWLVAVGDVSTVDTALASVNRIGFKLLVIVEAGITHRVTADKVLTIPSFTDGLLNEPVLKAMEIAAFITVKDFLVPLTALLNERFAIYTENVVAYHKAMTIKDKAKMRLALANSRWSPKFQVLNSPNDFVNPPESESGCWVVKPAMGFSSIGVKLVRDSRDIVNELELLRALIPSLLKRTPGVQNFDSPAFLIEEYVEGKEFSVETMTYQGTTVVLGIFVKSDMDGPWFEEKSFRSFVESDGPEYVLLAEAAAQILADLRFHNGPAHLEFRVNDSRLVLLDIGIRIGGGGLSHRLVEIATGADFFSAMLHSIVGQSLKSALTKTKNKVALLYLLQVGAGGKVKAFGNSDWPVSSCYTLIEYKQIEAVSKTLTPYPEYSGLPGFALLERFPDLPSDDIAIFENCSHRFDPLYEETTP